MTVIGHLFSGQNNDYFPHDINTQDFGNPNGLGSLVSTLGLSYCRWVKSTELIVEKSSGK